LFVDNGAQLKKENK